MKYRVESRYGLDHFEAATPREAAKQYLRYVDREVEGELTVVDAEGNMFTIPYEVTVSYDRWVGDPK